MPDWMPIITAIVAVIISVITARREWQFGKPEALNKYEDLVNDLMARMEKVEKENRALKAMLNEVSCELEDYRIGVVILITQMQQELGAQPKWQPKKTKTDTECK